MIHHISYRSPKCLQALQYGWAPMSEEDARVLDAQDAVQKRRLRLAGRPPYFAELPAYRLA